MTNGMWKPSPGSIYYVLEKLAKDELINEIFSTAKGHKRYIATLRGKARLLLERETLQLAWEKHLVLTKVMGDVLGYEINIADEAEGHLQMEGRAPNSPDSPAKGGDPLK